MFILRPSSPFRATEPEPDVETEEIKADKADEHFVDVGLPIPETYEIDIIRAMIQDPFRVFIYWEVRLESLKALTRYFLPEDVATFEVVLKLLEIAGRNEAFFNVSHTGRYWMMVFPDREYEFEIGVRSPVHGYIPLVRSNRVRTPRGTVSPERAEDKEYHLEPAEFVEVIADAGFAPEQTLNITVAPIPGASADDDLIQAGARRLSPTVREAIMVAADGGELTTEMIEQLPEPIRSELMQLLGAGDGRVASAGLTHYLPELLREALEDDREMLGDHIRPLNITQRFLLGASENVTRPGGDLRWPPSGVSGQGSGIRSKLLSLPKIIND
jgi:hypothetical protein